MAVMSTASDTGPPAGNAMDLTYSYTDPVNGGNAGHVWQITNNLNNNRSQIFNYDHLNRIVSAGTSVTTGAYCWGYSYTYDAWGNLISQAGWSPSYNGCTETIPGPSTADANNHISSVFSYDAAGNAIGESGYTYQWDGESRLKSATSSTGNANYLYDGDGKRVSDGEYYFYGPNDQVLGITDGSGNPVVEYVYLGNRRIAAVNPNGSSPRVYVGDLLGSARVITDGTGAIVYDADFTPFGAERAYTYSYPTIFKFEGKQRDNYTSNDFFGARYYSNRWGRWLSADWSNVPVAVPYANLSNPQTLNLYSMVSDDPESFADLDGHCPEHFESFCAGLENAKERFYNVFHGLGFRTDKGVEAAVHSYSPWLRDRGINPEGMTPQQIIHTYEAIQSAIENRQHTVRVGDKIFILGMIGAGGTRFTSKTLWEEGGAHIDVENPNPGQRPGQIHYQDAADNKYLYDFETKQFEGLSNTQNRTLLENPDVQDAIQKGFKYLGLEVQPDVLE